MIVADTKQFSTFDQRRKRMGLSCAALAKRTGLSLRTVQRVLSGSEPDPGFSTVAKLARELGVALRFDEDDVHALRRKQAEKKAGQIIALVQGTSALESQALSSEALRDLRERTINELLAGSNRKLWGD
jgi:transcriptional regulator with XRE-family HTH domain